MERLAYSHGDEFAHERIGDGFVDGKPQRPLRRRVLAASGPTSVITDPLYGK